MTEKVYSIQMTNDHVKVTFKPGTELSLILILEVLGAEFSFPRLATTNDIWDLRGCKPSPNLSANSIAHTVDFIKGRFNADMTHRKTALLVDNDLSFGVGRIFQTLGDHLPYEIELFTAEEEAILWLK